MILIDISNSFTKVAETSREEVGDVRRIPTGDLVAGRLPELLLETPGAPVVLASVVPEATRALRGFLPRDTRLLEVGAGTDLGIEIDYPDPASIGADRLANAVGASVFYGAPAIVVDLGTAVTFDILDATNRYIGGIIAPGLEVMTTYLHEKTALLPKVAPEKPAGFIGRSTREAILSGTVYGYCGMITSLVDGIVSELDHKAPVPVVATGGYAELLAAHCRAIHRVHPGLTLEGLRLIGNRWADAMRA